MSETAPNPFAPYRVVRELARGGMGVVYEVVDERTKASYALKTLLEGVGPEDLVRFGREAEALGKLDHPHVVKVHSARLDTHTPYLVQDLLSGGSLRDRLRHGPLPVAEAVAILAKVASGVGAAHAVGVLHRDLKPDNVLFDERGEPQVVDFGLAKATQVEVSQLTQTGMIIGTPAFMSPEQVTSPRDAREAADIYGLGALLYAMLTGGKPFSGSLLVTLEQVVHQPPVPPSRLNARVPTTVEAVCLQALAKDPTQRPASAEALAAAAELSLQDAPSIAPRWVVVALATSLLALLVGWVATREHGPPAQAPTWIGAGPRRAQTPRNNPQDRCVAPS